MEFYHPGHYIIQHALTAEELGISRHRLYEIMLGHEDIDLAIAHRMSHLIGYTPQYWMNTQLAYNLAKEYSWLTNKNQVILYDGIVYHPGRLAMEMNINAADLDMTEDEFMYFYSGYTDVDYELAHKLEEASDYLACEWMLFQEEYDEAVKERERLRKFDFIKFFLHN